MGKIKKYNAGIALEYCAIIPQDYTSFTGGIVRATQPYKDINGTSRTGISLSTSSTINNKEVFKNISPYSFIIPVASADTISNYNVEDYAINDNGATITFSATSDNVSKTITVNITNNTSSQISCGSIKFKKNINWQTNNYPNCTCDVMVMAYFFDKPFTLEAGESRTVAIKFDFS